MKKLFLLLGVLLAVSCTKKSNVPCCDSTGRYVLKVSTKNYVCIKEFPAVCHKTMLEQQREAETTLNENDSIISAFWRCY